MLNVLHLDTNSIKSLFFKILNDKDNYKIEDSYVDVSYDAYTNVLNKDSLSPNLINVA